MDRVIGVVGCTKKFLTVKKTANHEPTLRLSTIRLLLPVCDIPPVPKTAGISLVDDISVGELARTFMMSKE